MVTNDVLVQADERRGVISMVRTASDLPREREALRGFYRELVEALDMVDRERFTLVVDGRAAVGRNDEVFESVQAEFTESLFGGFRQVLAVLGTTAGKLQVNRYDHKADRARTLTFGTPEQAYQYIRERDARAVAASG